MGKRLDRREFLGLAAALAVAPAFQRPAARAALWRCALDGRLRWSLVGPAGSLVAGAEIVVELTGLPPIPLSTLEGVRRFRGGTRQRPTTAAVGRAGDLEITVQCSDEGAPRLDVSVRGLGDARQLAAIRFLDDARTTAAAAWLGGRRSQDDCRTIALPAADAAVGHWQFALFGGAGALGAAVGEAGGGAGEFIVEGRTWSARARFARRAVSADDRPAEASLTLLPGPAPLAALGADVASRLPAPLAPLWGWRTGPAFGPGVAESDVLESLDDLRRSAPAGGVVLLDDGCQRSLGDWTANERFPHGHRWLTARIREAGYEPGLWLAPFLVSQRSGIPATHPDWILSGDGGPVAFDGPPHWGGPANVLDASRRDVQDWLRLMARHAVQEWGYGVLMLDHLQAGGAAGNAGRSSAPFETLRAGLAALRAGAAGAAVIGARVPLQPALGLLDQVIIGDEAAKSREEIVETAEALAARSPMRRRAWNPGPVTLALGEPLSLDEARAWASCVAVTGSITLSGDRPDSLPEERAAILARTLPALSLAGGPVAAPHPGTGQPWQWLASDGRDWWTLALVNWDDESQRHTVDLAASGLRGPLAVYDVWTGERRPNVVGRLALTVPARSSVVLGLRRPRPVPFVLGSSRHVIQGAVDIESERWDAARRVLRGRSRSLDGRPYALAIAVPAGLHPTRCTAGSACSATHVHERQGVVRVDITGARGELDWEVGF